jgi:uncharacterized protein YkwD
VSQRPGFWENQEEEILAMRHWTTIVLAAAALTASCVQTTPGAQPAPAKQTRAGTATTPVRPLLSQEEQAIFDLANRERTARNLPRLKWNAKLAAAARAHAQKMAQAGTLSHQFSGEMDMGMRIRVAGLRFRSAAENVAQGPSAAVLHQEWMHSPAHRENILDPELDSLGVAVVRRNGQLFAVQDFALAAQ